MQHEEFESPEALRDTIKCFWYNSIELPEIQSGFEVVPDGYAEIIFHFGSDCSIAHEGHLQTLPSPFIMGLLNQPVHFHATKRLEVIGIRCFPWTVFDLLGLLPGRGGVRLFEHPIACLQSVLNDCIVAGKIAGAVALLQHYFLDARLGIAADSMLARAGLAMSAAKGTMPVSQVAAAAHATVRTLERKFRRSSGYTVKDVSGLMRFERVRNQLWRNPGINLAGLAVDMGYTDQSHLSREFKRYSGTSPAAFARKIRVELQAAGNNIVAFIQS